MAQTVKFDAKKVCANELFESLFKGKSFPDKGMLVNQIEHRCLKIGESISNLSCIQLENREKQGYKEIELLAKTYYTSKSSDFVYFVVDPFNLTYNPAKTIRVQQ